MFKQCKFHQIKQKQCVIFAFVIFALMENFIFCAVMENYVFWHILRSVNGYKNSSNNKSNFEQKTKPLLKS